MYFTGIDSKFKELETKNLQKELKQAINNFMNE